MADEKHRFVQTVGPRPEQMVLAVTSNVTSVRQVSPGHEIQYRVDRQDQLSKANMQRLILTHYTIY